MADCHMVFAPTHTPPSTEASAVSPHAALLPCALECHPSSMHVGQQTMATITKLTVQNFLER